MNETITINIYDLKPGQLLALDLMMQLAIIPAGLTNITRLAGGCQLHSTLGRSLAKVKSDRRDMEYELTPDDVTALTLLLSKFPQVLAGDYQEFASEIDTDFSQLIG